MLFELDTTKVDKETLFLIYKENMAEKRAQMEALWNSARFFLSIFTTLTTIVLGGTYAFLRGEIKYGFYSLLSLGIIQLINFALILHAKKQLLNIYKNFLEIIATIGKASYLLGLMGDISIYSANKSQIQKDKSLVSPRYILSLIEAKNTKDFIEKELTRKGNWYHSMSRIYNIFIIISLTMGSIYIFFGLLYLVKNWLFK